eukprot:TRINITY_DN1977_c0_g1_i2.p1 TRINITY_DN1977_c0_g1~~TRINITY_DN1977_c0_g1_i2.p1  ORF type:complete len:412 (-),score=112.58 TRINITY_DN1977_c0_g1_i2:107-1342(-)
MQSFAGSNPYDLISNSGGNQTSGSKKKSKPKSKPSPTSFNPPPSYTSAPSPSVNDAPWMWETWEKPAVEDEWTEVMDKKTKKAVSAALSPTPLPTQNVPASIPYKPEPARIFDLSKATLPVQTPSPVSVTIAPSSTEDEWKEVKNGVAALSVDQLRPTKLTAHKDSNFFEILPTPPSSTTNATTTKKKNKKKKSVDTLETEKLRLEAERQKAEAEKRIQEEEEARERELRTQEIARLAEEQRLEDQRRFLEQQRIAQEEHQRRVTEQLREEERRIRDEYERKLKEQQLLREQYERKVREEQERRFREEHERMAQMQRQQQRMFEEEERLRIEEDDLLSEVMTVAVSKPVMSPEPVRMSPDPDVSTVLPMSRGTPANAVNGNGISKKSPPGFGASTTSSPLRCLSVLRRRAF